MIHISLSIPRQDAVIDDRTGINRKTEIVPIMYTAKKFISANHSSLTNLGFGYNAKPPIPS